MFGALKKRRAQKKFGQEMVEHRADLADWEDAEEAIDRMLEVVRDCVAGNIDAQFTDRSDYGFMRSIASSASSQSARSARCSTISCPNFF
ncbi:MAG: hypothetical protein ACKOFT_06770 [Actinomycetota bacterium]